MNIIEAIKSGNKCKRRCWKKQWIGPGINDQRGAYLTIEDLLADDWEVKETTNTITRSQFEAAWKRVVIYDAPQVKELLAKELGL